MSVLDWLDANPESCKAPPLMWIAIVCCEMALSHLHLSMRSALYHKNQINIFHYLIVIHNAHSTIII